MGPLEKKVIATIVYFSQFLYAPTFKELYIFLEKKTSEKVLKMVLTSLKKHGKVVEKQGLYTLGEYSKNIDITAQRLKISQLKIAKTKMFLKSLSKVSTLKLLGMSGSVAMNNADYPDDVDIFLITSKHKMWITRLLLLSYTQLAGIRRKRAQSEAKDMICLNMFLDESDLSMPKEKQTLYVAHEILQMKPVFSKNNTYERFLTANRWIFDIFPNAEKYYIQDYKKISNNIKNSNLILVFFGNFLELFAKKIQLFLINRHRTSERVTDTQLWFFPRDYEKKLKKP